jgi:ABC-type branched-subunit amino acid transport system substrate-binding protein
VLRIAASLVLLLTLLGAACGKDADQAPAGRETPGVSATEIRIGSSLALSGHASFLGRQTLLGAMSYLTAVNDRGGVHGRKITLLAEDDGYDPPRCVANTQKLIADEKVFALFGYVGTPTTIKIIPLLEEARIPLVGAFTGANALRDPFQRFVINVRASYYQETRAAVKHLVLDLGLRKIAVFYQYDAYGFDGLTGAELALKEYGLAPVAQGSYIRGTQEIEDGLAKIAASGAQAVVMIGTYAPCAKFIQEAKRQGFAPLFYAVSFVGAGEMARILGPGDQSLLIMSEVVPPPDLPETQSLLWGVAEYRDLLARYAPDEAPSTVGLEGFVDAKILVEGLRRAGPNLTREKFIAAVESIRDYSLGIANTVSFSPQNHQGLERVYFTRMAGGKFTLINDWNRLAKGLAAPAAP